MRRYCLAVLIGLDILANALLGGAAGETISKRTARNRDLRGWRHLARFLEAVDPDHLAYGPCECPALEHRHDP